jgi:transposase-like protein
VNDDDDDALENKSNKRQFSASTRSSKFLPKLRDTFDDSDDDDDSANSRYKSWAKQDINEYRNNYPNARQDTRIKDNYQFYTNQISSHPDGDYIDNIHKEWFGKYRHLEYHHGYIQWLFPLQEKGLNWSAEPLQKHEIELIKKDKKALKRILKSYELM